MTREEAIHRLEGGAPFSELYDEVWENALIMAIEALKSKPVVRCKDCKWFNDIGCAIRIVDDSDKPKDDDYCSFGEQKNKRKHSYWKVWGFSATCAECGHEDMAEYKYCSNCGSIMDEPSVSECPPLCTTPSFKVFTCPECKTDFYEISRPNYCRICGAEMEDDLEVAHCENCKYEDTGGGMTNRQYLATLSNEELANTIYDVIVNRVGRRYNSSRLGVAQWLGELYREDDFIKGFAYYADNKKIMEGGENG